MNVIVAGCGRVGSQLAELLSYEAHNVVVIDSDRRSFRRLGGTFNGVTLEGVAFDEELLHEAGIESADAFAAVTNFDNTNLMAAEIASNVYRVPTVMSRLYNPDKELTFYKMGIDYVCSTTLIADRIREKLFQPEEVIIQQDRLDVGIQVVEFSVPEDAEGKLAGDLNYGVSSRLIVLMRDNKAIEWNESTPLRRRDRVIVTMRKEGWRVIKGCLGEDSCPANIMPVSGPALETVSEEPSGARVIIGGCSMVGAHLAYLLSMEGHDITLIDVDPERFKRLPGNYGGRVLEGMVYDEETLVRAGIREADAFTSVTKFDNTNLIAAEVARHVFNVPHVLARLFNPDKEATFQALSMNYICGTRLLAQVLLERMLKPPVHTRTSCLYNIFDLVEFECPPPWDGKPVSFAMDKSRAAFTYIVRRSTGFMPDENFVLRKGDTVTALATPRRSHKLEKYLNKYQKG